MRLQRAKTQIDSVIRMIESDSQPLELLAQLASAIGFLKKVASEIISDIINFQEKDDENWADIEKALKYITKFQLQELLKILPEKPDYGRSNEGTINNENGKYV